MTDDLETFTVDDRPDEAINAVVDGREPSIALIIWVRGCMAQSRRDCKANGSDLFERFGDPPKADPEDIALEVFDACDLVAFGEPNGYFGAAWLICEAAGWGHLAGES